jgi:hypothetical protein
MEFTKEQWSLLRVYEDRNYVAVVHGDIVRQYPALDDDPTLRERLYAAFARTKELEFNHERQIVRFLYLEAITPGFYRKPGVAAWLEKKGATPEERFDMMMDVSRARLRARSESR